MWRHVWPQEGLQSRFSFIHLVRHRFIHIEIKLQAMPFNMPVANCRPLKNYATQIKMLSSINVSGWSRANIEVHVRLLWTRQKSCQQKFYTGYVMVQPSKQWTRGRRPKSGQKLPIDCTTSLQRKTSLGK